MDGRADTAPMTNLEAYFGTPSKAVSSIGKMTRRFGGLTECVCDLFDECDDCPNATSDEPMCLYMNEADFSESFSAWLGKEAVIL